MTIETVQGIAKETMAYAQVQIHAGMKLLDLRRLCEEKMRSLGAEKFWYWDIGAFVFSAEDTMLSVSGRTYRTSDRVIHENDVVTIDLSPQIGDFWGDYARTIVLEEGHAVQHEDVRDEKIREGLQMEQDLHNELKHIAHPEMTFEQLYLHMNAMIRERGFVNLDFLGNLGHSIEVQKEDRVYIEKGNLAKLGSKAYFTFEPHIAQQGGIYGYKMENIYCFDGVRLREV